MSAVRDAFDAERVIKRIIRGNDGTLLALTRTVWDSSREYTCLRVGDAFSTFLRRWTDTSPAIRQMANDVKAELVGAVVNSIAWLTIDEYMELTCAVGDFIGWSQEIRPMIERLPGGADFYPSYPEDSEWGVSRPAEMELRKKIATSHMLIMPYSTMTNRLRVAPSPRVVGSSHDHAVFAHANNAFGYQMTVQTVVPREIVYYFDNYDDMIMFKLTFS